MDGWRCDCVRFLTAVAMAGARARRRALRVVTEADFRACPTRRHGGAHPETLIGRDMGHAAPEHVRDWECLFSPVSVLLDPRSRKARRLGAVDCILGTQPERDLNWDLELARATVAILDARAARARAARPDTRTGAAVGA